MTQCWRCIHRHTKEEHPECYRRVSEVQFKAEKKAGYQRRLLYLEAWKTEAVQAEVQKDAV